MQQDGTVVQGLGKGRPQAQRFLAGGQRFLDATELAQGIAAVEPDVGVSRRVLQRSLVRGQSLRLAAEVVEGDGPVEQSNGVGRLAGQYPAETVEGLFPTTGF